MSNLELIFNMLGEETTRQIAITNNSQGLQNNQKAAKEGGQLAGESRKRLEAKTGLKVVNPNNFLDLFKKEKKKNLE